MHKSQVSSTSPPFFLALLCLHTFVVTSTRVWSRAGLAIVDFQQKCKRSDGIGSWSPLRPQRRGFVCINKFIETNHGLGTHGTGAGLCPAEQCRKLLRGPHLRVSGAAKILHAVSFQFARPRGEQRVLCSFAVC